jgi:hypothetical protein
VRGQSPTSARSCEDSTGHPYGFVLALAKQAVAAFQVPKTFSDVLPLEETERLKGITKTTAGGLIYTPAVARIGSSSFASPLFSGFAPSVRFHYSQGTGYFNEASATDVRGWNHGRQACRRARDWRIRVYTDCGALEGAVA